MTYPANAADLRELVTVMREIGAVEACGVRIGPAPTASEEPERPITEDERRALAFELRKQERLQELRDMLAATGKSYSDEELMVFMDPRELQETQ